ncbi:hypothetical protein BJV78DRAFT_548980 [Lactifluus subvellereus]|nr:hypothetical protein BJV78DRAFT_548980 [Lactifluus subvellereus]
MSTVALTLPPSTHCGLSPLPFFSFTTLVSFVDFRIHPKLSTKTAVINFQECTSIFFHPCFYRLSHVSSTTHCMLSHLALVIYFLDFVQIRKAKSQSCTKERPRSVDISTKTQMPISPAVTASIHYIGRPSLAGLLIYPPSYCVLPCVTDNVQVISSLAANSPCSWFLGRYRR